MLDRRAIQGNVQSLHQPILDAADRYIVMAPAMLAMMEIRHQFIGRDPRRIKREMRKAAERVKVRA